jgi:hypothetical protein
MVLPGNINLPQSPTLRAFRPPIVQPETPVRETPSASFGDLVRMLAEGIAAAQASLDRTSAEMVVEMANTHVDIVPNITQIIDEDGNITYESGDPQTVSLLHLGVRPTFYQFSQATVEVVMDIEIVETETEKGEKRNSLFAQTYNVRYERKLNREVTTTSKLTATLVPVPMPVQLEPTMVTTTPPAEGGG